MPQVSGPFSVKIVPQEADPRSEAAALGRLALDKTFSGPLTATSVGQMLAVQSGVEGSAGYVAIESVTGTLEGRTGSFALQHSGHANRGRQTLQINVIADTGKGELAGLAGSMQIVVADDGSHTYVFDYDLPASD